MKHSIDLYTRYLTVTKTKVSIKAMYSFYLDNIILISFGLYSKQAKTL